MEAKTKGEEFYDKALQDNTENNSSEILKELRELNISAKKTEKNVKYLRWFLVVLPLIYGCYIVITYIWNWGKDSYSWY